MCDCCKIMLDKRNNEAYNSNRNTKEVIKMAETEMLSIQNMGAAIASLPEEKKQFFIGFAEGVAAMADQVKAKQPATDAG